MKYLKLVFIALLAGAIAGVVAGIISVLVLENSQQAAIDLYFGETYTPKYKTQSISCLGGDNFSPAQKLGISPTAANVWDMEIIGDKLYIGSGNYDTNSGSAGLLYWDMTERRFYSYSLPEEQISSFKVYGDTLYIPGIDPHKQGCHDMGGSGYIFDGTTLHFTAEIPNACHCFDITYFQEKLWYGIGTKESNFSIARSNIQGEEMEMIPCIDADGNLFSFFRVYNLFTVKDRLYAWGSVWQGRENYNVIAEYNFESDTFVITRKHVMAPQYVTMETAGVPVPHLKVIDDVVVYIAGGSIYATKDFQEYTLMPSYTVGAEVYDILVQDQKLYVLVNRREKTGYKIIVYSTSDLQHWSEVFEFNNTSLARSFELKGSTWYFGIGSNYSSTATEHNGELLEVKVVS